MSGIGDVGVGAGGRPVSALAEPASIAPEPRTRRISSPGAVLAVAALGTFMAFVDATIVNIAIPNIHEDFTGSSLSNVSWVLNAYNIVFAAFLVGGGQLADLLGRRRIFCIALIIFTVASAACAAAPSLGLLVAARLLQAAGAAALVPSSLAIVLEAYPGARRPHAVSLWAAIAALAAGIGPALGGILITASSWRLVFLVNIPIGIVAYVLANRVIVESRAPGRRRVPDLIGGVVLAFAIASLVLGIVKGQEWGWASAQMLAALAIAVLLGVYFVLRSSTQRTPVVDLSLLRIRSFALSNAVTVVMASGFFGYTLCNVLFLTSVWQYSILKAGLSLTPGPIVAIAVAAPASRAVSRLGHRAVAVPGALIWAAGAAFFATQLGTSSNFLGEWLPGMVILGVGAGLSFPTLSGAAVESVPGPRFALATSLNAVSRQIGAALGVAVLIAILGNTSAPSIPRGLPAPLVAALEQKALHPRPAHVRQRLAVCVRMLPVRGPGVPRAGGGRARRGPERPVRARARERHGLAGTGERAAGARAAEPGRVRRAARGRRAPAGDRVPAQRARVRGPARPDARACGRARGRPHPAPRRLAVPRGRARRCRLSGARGPPRGRARGPRGERRAHRADDQHPHARGGPRRARAAEPVRAQRLGQGAAGHRAAEDRQGSISMRCCTRSRSSR